jgi:CRP-like cAMP-binding protein
MLEQTGFSSCPETPHACNGRPRPESAPHSPRQNLLLAALPMEDYGRLLAFLEPVHMPPGWTIHDAGVREKFVYFLTAGIASRFYVTEDGKSSELAVTGNEGVIGVALFLSGESTSSQAVMVSAGYAYRLRAGVLEDEFRKDSPLAHLLLRYTQALIAQTGQIAACNRHHTLEQQLSRWLLAGLDRSPSTTLSMTHELIANILGVRREGVSEAAGKLQKAGLIHYHRGHITVVDRVRLEANACECYAVVKREYDRLLRPAGSIGAARGTAGGTVPAEVLLLHS